MHRSCALFDGTQSHCMDVLLSVHRHHIGCATVCQAHVCGMWHVDVACLLNVACCMLYVAYRMLHVACCMLRVACCMLHVCMLHIACCMCSTSLVGIVTKAVPRHELGTVLGMIASLGSMTYIIGPTIGGLAIRYYGPTAPHMMSFGMALIIAMYAHSYFPDLHGVNQSDQHEMIQLIPEANHDTEIDIQPSPTGDVMQHNTLSSSSPLAVPLSSPHHATVTSAGMRSPLTRVRLVAPHAHLHPPPPESPPLSPSPSRAPGSLTPAHTAPLVLDHNPAHAHAHT